MDHLIDCESKAADAVEAGNDSPGDSDGEEGEEEME